MAQYTEHQAALIRQHLGTRWADLKESGAFGEIVAAWNGNESAILRAFQWQRTGGFRRNVKLAAGTVAAPVNEHKLLDGLAADLQAYMQRMATMTHTVQGLSQQFDRSEASIRTALEAVRQAGYEVAVTDDDRVKLRRHAAPTSDVYVHPGWGEKTLLYGVVSDTHFGTTHCCADELSAAYDLFQEEGVLGVLHCGDLMDGPAHLGYQGHNLEVLDEAQTAPQQVDFTHRHYPQRPGITTYFIESGKSHAGWEFARSGFSMGKALAEGYQLPSHGPDGVGYSHKPGREDMVFMGMDERTIACGPENLTTITLLHPDGGTAYALSYNLQKWAEGVEGGVKPNAALIGHYHKFCNLFPRNIHCCSVPTMQWQTPFMQRKRIAAHVGAMLLELRVDSDGTIRRSSPVLLPFYRPRRPVYIVGEVA